MWKILTLVETTVEVEEVSKSKKDSEYYTTPEFDMAFSIHKRLIFIVIKQKEAKLRYPIFLDTLKAYKNEIEKSVRNLLQMRFILEFGNNAEYATQKVDEVIKNEGFLENLITSVQRGGFFDVFAWANVNNLSLSSELQKDIFISTKTLFDKYYLEYTLKTYRLENDILKIINEYSIVTLLYDIDVKTVFLDYFQFFIYANIVIDNNNGKLSKSLDSEEIESIHNKIITPLEKYPSFVFHDLHNSRISIEKSNEFDRMAGPKLNLSVDLNSDLDSIPKIIQNYLLEYYRLSGSNLKEDSKLDSINNLNRTIEFLESLYNEESKIDRRDELFSLSLMLFFYDYIFEDYVNEKHIFESVKDMKDFYGKRISLKSQEERKELEDSYRLFSLEKNIHHASSNKKKIKIDDFFSYLENFLKEHECSKLSKKTDNGIDLILDDGKFTKSKNLTKDAFAKLKKRTLASKATILQRAIDS